MGVQQRVQTEVRVEFRRAKSETVVITGVVDPNIDGAELSFDRRRS